MATNGLEVFDKTLQSTNIWLNEISSEIGPDRRLAWHVLGVVLRAVRDRLPIEQAAHLGAELPIMIRGVYYDQFRPGTLPQVSLHSLDHFCERIQDDMATVRPVDPKEALRAVFGVLSRHLPEGQVAKVRDSLPKDVRALWRDAETRAASSRTAVPGVASLQGLGRESGRDAGRDLRH